MADLTAVVEGIRRVRRMTDQLQSRGLIRTEEIPGRGSAGRGRVAANSCAKTPGAIMPPALARSDRGPRVGSSSDLRAHGTGLRVVDASVFPRIPGLFIACPVYMIAEKAADSFSRLRPHRQELDAACNSRSGNLSPNERRVV